MKTGIGVLFRLAWRSYFPGGDRLGRRTWKRLLVMTAFLPVFLAVQLIHWCALLLDEVLLRGYREVQIKRPLFIVGVPRSGTTLLHRLLARDEGRFTTFRLWELLLAPAISEKYFWIGLYRLDRLIGSPLSRLLRAVEWLVLGRLDEIHKTSLADPEEDYLSLLPIGGCFLLVLPFPLRDEIWRLAYFDDWGEEDRRRLMDFYRRMVQRHLYVRGRDKQLLSKNPSFSPMVQTLMQSFPDCHIVANLRNPYEAIPSLLSTMMDGARIFGNDVRGHEYRDELVKMLKFFYEHLLGSLGSAPTSRHGVVRFDDLTADPRGVVQSLYKRLEYELSAEYAAALQAEHERALGYRSRHRYSLEQFDLTADGIRQDLGFVFEELGFDTEYVEAPKEQLSPSC